MPGTKDVKLTFFKESGKYYTEETVAIPATAKEVFQISDWIRENVKSYPSMYLVAMLDEYENGYPILITPDRRV